MAYQTKTKQILGTLKQRLEESEKRRQRELCELQELSRAVMRIQNTSDRLPVEMSRADSMVECRAKSASEALQMLKDGNERFLVNSMNEGQAEAKYQTHPLDFHVGQRPHTVLVTCSDSRVPPELVFEQGLGDLFVVRIAGNAVDTLARASILYGLQHLGAPLVVVMGHESCGAVQASLASDDQLVDEPADIKALVRRIRSGLKTLVDSPSKEENVMCGVVCNVHHTVEELRGHPDVAAVAAKKGVRIVGAYYAFNGAVTFFDEGNIGAQ